METKLVKVVQMQILMHLKKMLLVDNKHII